jgi:CheY-like chemotaxis protein
MGQPTLLIAHADAWHRKLLDMLLSPGEWQLYMCENGRQVLEYLRANTPALAVLDTQLAFVGGLDLCAKIKGVKRLAQTPVVLVTSPREDGEEAARFRELAHFVKADLVVQQPLGDKNLRERVEQLLGVTPASDAPPAGNTQMLEEALQALERNPDTATLRTELEAARRENQELKERLERLRQKSS